MLISYIIPVYNGEEYLKKCIDSLIQQDYGNEKYEIICIDDCSIDGSASIIKEYQKTYPNVVLIENPKNLKTGTVCNIGLDNAKGDYIWVIGQDDWINEDSIRKLASITTSTNPEVVAFNYKRVDFSENELHSAEVFDNSALIQGSDYIRTKFGDAFSYYLLGYEWRAIFNREYLRNQYIRFPDGGIYEDTTFLFKAIMYSQRFISLSDFFYYYRVNPQSITDVNKKHIGTLVFEFAFKVGNEVLDLAKKIEQTHPDFSIQLSQMAIWYFNGFTTKIIGASMKEKINFYNECRKNTALLNTARNYLKPISLILSKSFIGIIVATLLKPSYIFKKKVIDRNKKKQEWCY